MRMTRKTRVFTVDEANALLSQLRALFGRVPKEIRIQRGLQDGIRRAAAKADLGGGSPGSAQYVESILRMKGLMDEIQSLGVEVKDLHKGICDFPHRRDGRLVYLCWRLGEEKVGHWHPLKKGFRGRRPL